MASSRPLLIAGQWKATSATARIINPFDGSLIAEVCQGGAKEAEETVQAADAAFVASRRLPAHARAAVLLRIAEALVDRQEEFARSIAGEAGKPISDARREVSRATQTFTIAAEEAKRIPGDVVPLDLTPGSDSYLGVTRRFPIGPVLGITPFNFPLNLVAHKVAPCLAAGNTMVLKPAPQTPLTALLLGEVVTQAGAAPGVLNILPCENAVAERMVTDERFKLVSFTGSAPVGWMLKGKAGKKRVVLELGGNAGVIVEPDADVELAASRCAVGGFGYAGQTCISVQRVFVHESIADRFTQAMLERVRRYKAGDPFDEGTVVGPLINEAAACRIEGWIGEAVAQGGRVLLGGTRSGALLEATVMSNVQPHMKVSSQEVFGPLVTVTPYARFADAIRALNDSEYGLQAGVFTQDIDRIFTAFRDLEVGTVLANEIPTFRADHMPYGGVKGSGLGREGVRYAIEEMTELKLLVLNLRDPHER